MREFSSTTYRSIYDLAGEAARVEVLAVPEQDARLLEVVAGVAQVVAHQRAVVHAPIVGRDLVLVVREVTGEEI